jgi:hypothetical protein
LCAASPFLLAQSVLDPRIVEFEPSPDHNARTSDGQAVVTRYDLEFYVLNAQTPLLTVSLGKPSPDNDGIIRANFESLLASIPAAGVLYVARVAAVGPGGRGTSDPSNQFGFGGGAPPDCSMSVNPASLSLPGGASTGTVLVTAPDGCSWSAAPGASWVSITSGASGTGDGSVRYSVSANPLTTARSTSITIGGQSIPLTQAGAPCTYSLSGSNATAPPAGSSGTVTVTTQSSCSWTAASNVGWITVTGGGPGSGQAGYSVAAYSGTTARTGTLTIAGRTFTVTQNGVACTPSITPTTASVPASGATDRSVSVSVASACGWTASDNSSWITITGGSSGEGAGTVTYTVAANSGSSSRTGTVTIAGLTHTITQGGITCNYSVSPSSDSVGSSGGTLTATVTAPSGCSWTATDNASWVSISSGASGTGNGTVRYTVSANSGSTARSATLTVAGRSLAVTQAANTCTFTVTPTSQTVSRSGGVMTAAVSAPAGCTWRATESSSWVSITGGASGSGNGTVRYSVSAYSGSSARSATLTVAGQPVRVTQSANTPPTTPGGLRIVGSGSG